MLINGFLDYDIDHNADFATSGTFSFNSLSGTKLITTNTANPDLVFNGNAVSPTSPSSGSIYFISSSGYLASRDSVNNRFLITPVAIGPFFHKDFTTTANSSGAMTYGGADVADQIADIIMPFNGSIIGIESSLRTAMATTSGNLLTIIAQRNTSKDLITCSFKTTNATTRRYATNTAIPGTYTFSAGNTVRIMWKTGTSFGAANNDGQCLIFVWFEPNFL